MSVCAEYLGFPHLLQRMASNVSYGVQDSLNCGVCFERYNNSNHQPKILSCQHTVCSDCIKSLIEDFFVELEDDTDFKCPFCREGVSSDEIRTNLLVIEIVQAVGDYAKAHLFCPMHSYKGCQLVCTHCCQPICTVCVTEGKHTGHTVHTKDGAMIEMKKRLNTVIEKRIATLQKATAAKQERLEKELAQKEQDIDSIVCMISESLNEWKKTQQDIARQATAKALRKEIETNKAQQMSVKEKLQSSDLRSIMYACTGEEAKAEVNSDVNTDVHLQKINLDQLHTKLNYLCDTVKKLIKDNEVLPSSFPAPSRQEDMNESPITWDFMVHLCSFVFPQKDPDTHPFIPQCVKRVANVYNRNRNTQFLRVVHDKRKGLDKLLCRTDDFAFEYDCSENTKHTVCGEWMSGTSQKTEHLEKWKDVLHDPEYAAKIKNALEVWIKTLPNIRKGRPELSW